VTDQSPRWRRWFRRFGIAALFLAAAVAGTTGGVLFAFVGDLPQIKELDNYELGTITRVLGRDGALVGEFATERRVVVTYDQIPQVLRNAIVASEDADFFTPRGIDIKAIGAMVVRRVLGRQHSGGASTITQQLARHLFLSHEMAIERQTNNDLPLERKIKEWLLAIQIEKRYTKPEILTMYCNKMWGHTTLCGVEAASRLYFGKSVTGLDLDEAALIAGLLQGNVRQSPYVNMKAALERRAYVLDRMAEQQFITKADAEAAKKRPIVVGGSPSQTQSVSPYFLETIRTYLEEKYTAKTVYEAGLTVKTGLDVGLQTAVNRALDNHLRQLDKQRGWRKPARNVLDAGKTALKTTLETYRDPRWPVQLTSGNIVPALVIGTDGGVIRARVGKFVGTIGRTGYAWTKRRADALVRAGDLIEVKIGKLNAGGVFDADLEQPPAIEGAVVAVDNHTGQILAMTGGASFERSQFNRATQAKRQVGSLFKPFVYTAAIDKGGYTAASMLADVHMSFEAGPGQPPYEPQNYDREFQGELTLRRALEQSRNVPAVAMMQTLGPSEVIKYPRLLGLTTPLPEFLSVAIGAAEGTLLEMTSAYSAYPNQGVRMAPATVLAVADREGNVLEQYRPEPHDALRADTAFIMTQLLHGVVENGTAAGAKDLDWPLGGKTGTTDDYTDAWFIGFDPDITIGVWIGFDQKKVIADRATGTTVALPLWTSI
jgi:penicillin-binding protein 1A